MKNALRIGLVCTVYKWYIYTCMLSQGKTLYFQILDQTKVTKSTHSRNKIFAIPVLFDSLLSSYPIVQHLQLTGKDNQKTSTPMPRPAQVQGAQNSTAVNNR